MTRIAFIGAGSGALARRLVTDIFSFDELDDCTLVLMDIDSDRLSRIRHVAEGIADHNDLSIDILATTDRREAIQDADYVINMIAVGGEEPFENEIRIPQAYGVGQAVGDTLGPGGIFRAMRTIPTILELAHEMEECCPDALLLNYSNPMAMICWAVDEATEIDVVGLCHSVQGTAQTLAEYVDVPLEEIEYWVAGINHMAWFLEFEHDGRDLYPDLQEAVDSEELYDRDNVRFEILRHFGAFVTESSHHVSEYLPYFRTDQALIDRLTPEADVEAGSVKWMATGAYLDYWRSYQPDSDAPEFENEDFEIRRSQEYGARIIHSIEADHTRRMNLNVRNDTGVIENLPNNACVEVPCLVDGTGIHPCDVGALPAQLAALNRSNISVQELSVEAVLEENRDSLFHAAKLDPLTAAACTPDEIHAMTEDLLAANADYLPEYLSTA